MGIHLDWSGPLVVGRNLPASQAQLDLLRGKGVYLWCREYPNGNLVTYVGRTNDVGRRLEQWLGQFLTLRCKARRADGTEFGDYDPLQFFKHMGNVDEFLEIAKSETKMTRFYYAFTPDIANAEGCLIHGMKHRALSTSGSTRQIVFGQNQPPFDRSTVLRHSTSGLVETEAERGTLAYILMG